MLIITVRMCATKSYDRCYRPQSDRIGSRSIVLPREGLLMNLNKLKPIIRITLFLFIHSCITPYAAQAFHAAPWWGGGITTGPTGVPPGPWNNQKNPLDPNATRCMDPVALGSGEFSYICPDLSLPGPGIDVNISHIYKEGQNFNYRYGHGWMLNYHWRIKTYQNGDAIVVGGGRRELYTYHSSYQFH